jgi:hypothetical protein
MYTLCDHQRMHYTHTYYTTELYFLYYCLVGKHVLYSVQVTIFSVCGTSVGNDKLHIIQHHLEVVNGVILRPNIPSTGGHCSVSSVWYKNTEHETHSEYSKLAFFPFHHTIPSSTVVMLLYCFHKIHIKF